MHLFQVILATRLLEKKFSRKSVIQPNVQGASKRIPKAKSIMPPPSRMVMEGSHDEEFPVQGACAGIPPEGEIDQSMIIQPSLPTSTDVRVLNQQLVVGLEPWTPMKCSMLFNINGKESILLNLLPIKCMMKRVR